MSIKRLWYLRILISRTKAVPSETKEEPEIKKEYSHHKISCDIISVPVVFKLADVNF